MNRNSPLNSDYVVQRGDSLWKIAERQYGSGNAWQAIAKENRIDRPQLVFSGQRLRLPVLGGGVNNVRQICTASTLAPRWMEAMPISYPTYEWEFKKSQEISQYPYKVKLTIFGKLKFQKKGALSNFTITNLKDIQIKAENEAKSTYSDLISGVSATFSPFFRKPELSGELSSVLKTPGGGKLAFTVDIKPTRIALKCASTAVVGNYKGYAIEGTFGYEIEVEGNEDFTLPYPVAVLKPIYSNADVIRVVITVAVGTIVLVVLAKVLLAVAAAMGLALASVLAFVLVVKYVSGQSPTI